MNTVATTKMSSKGQVVIPEEIRKKLNLVSGSRFVVLGEEDVVIMKTISSPSMDEFSTLIKKTRTQAKAAGMTKADITKAIDDVRAE